MSGRFTLFFPSFDYFLRPVRSRRDLRRFTTLLSLPSSYLRQNPLLITPKIRHKHARRASSTDNRRDRDHSPSGLRGAISGFLHPHGAEERRSRSSVGERRGRKSHGDSMSEEEEVVIRRGGEKWR